MGCNNSYHFSEEEFISNFFSDIKISQNQVEMMAQKLIKIKEDTNDGRKSFEIIREKYFTSTKEKYKNINIFSNYIDILKENETEINEENTEMEIYLALLLFSKRNEDFKKNLKVSFELIRDGFKTKDLNLFKKDYLKVETAKRIFNIYIDINTSQAVECLKDFYDNNIVFFCKRFEKCFSSKIKNNFVEIYLNSTSDEIKFSYFAELIYSFDGDNLRGNLIEFQQKLEEVNLLEEKKRMTLFKGSESTN